jgi:hypothetical protein
MLTHRQKKSIKDVVTGRLFADKRHMKSDRRIKTARAMAVSQALENEKNK